MEAIKVTDVIEQNLNMEDAIVLRDIIKNSIEDKVVLDFSGIMRVPTTFLCCLLTDLINKYGRDYIASHIQVKNLNNISDYNRVLLGTAFLDGTAKNTAFN